MNTFMVFAVVCVAFCVADGYYDVVEDESGSQYYLVPIDSHLRVRRQSSTSYSLTNTGAGLSHTQTLLNNPNHKLDGTANIYKPFPGPLSTGAKVDYLHKPSGSGVSVGAQNTRGLGTDLKASGTYNFINANQGRTTAGVTGEYGRHFGGPGGNQKPNYGVLLGVKHNF